MKSVLCCHATLIITVTEHLTVYQRVPFSLTLYNKILYWSKLKEFADNKINVTEKLKFVLGRVKNIVGKGGNAGNQHFLLFTQCFQKASI